MQDIIQFASQYQILVVTWLGLLIAVLYTVFIDLIYKIKVITSHEATYLINKDNAIIIDLRKHSDFCDGHIVGAINVLPTDIKMNNINELNKYKSHPIIVVDTTDIQAHKSARALNIVGFRKVFILKDGILGWNKKNIPLVCNKIQKN